MKNNCVRPKNRTSRTPNFYPGCCVRSGTHTGNVALEHRIQRANLPERWSLETFPFDHQPGVSRKQIRTFAELDFLAKAENIVFIGPTAVGKTGLASAFCLRRSKMVTAASSTARRTYSIKCTRLLPTVPRANW